MSRNHSAHYVETRLLPGLGFTGGKLKRSLGQLAPLNHIQAAELEQNLNLDAENFFFSAVASFGDAVRGLDSGFYTWSTVKLYYSAFYTARAFLALRGICIYYDGSTPFLIESEPGALIRTPPNGSKNNTTHGLVLNTLKNTPSSLSRFLESQHIEGEHPLDWLEEKRNNANYKNIRFLEPDIPSHMKAIFILGIRKATLGYLNESSEHLIFDPDHSIISLPLYMLKKTREELNRIETETFTDEEVSWIKKIFKDQSGQISHIINTINL